MIIILFRQMMLQLWWWCLIHGLRECMCTSMYLSSFTLPHHIPISYPIVAWELYSWFPSHNKPTTRMQSEREREKERETRQVEVQILLS
jgi:hypothetical protein